jgi:hypothetical protein
VAMPRSCAHFRVPPRQLLSYMIKAYPPVHTAQTAIVQPFAKFPVC